MKIEKIDVPFAQIPNSVLQNEDLSLKAKGLWAYLQSKPNGWDFAYRRISQEIKEGERSIRSALKELEDAGFLDRKRQSSGKMKYALLYKSLASETPSRAKRPSDETLAILNKDIKKERIIINKESTTNVVEGKPSYGDPEINNVIEEFEKRMGFKSGGRKQADRNCAKHLLNNFTFNQIQAMLVYCSTDEYAPRIGSVEKLWYKRGDIIAGIKALQMKTQKNTTEDDKINKILNS